MYGEKSLNVTDDANVVEEYEEIIEELVDEETGELSNANRFWLANPLFIQHKAKNNYDISITGEARRHARELEAATTGEAVRKMADMMKEQFRRKN